jgi:predicted O-linked N-acetylglucosamine transferase (SPINDLY family)
MNRAAKRRQKKIDKKASRKAIDLPRENLSNLFAKAVKGQKSGQFEVAKKLYQKILNINPNLAEVHCNLGSIQNILGDNANAEKSYHNAIKLKPEYAEAHGNLGNALVSMGRLEEAIICYKEALIHKSKDANLHNSLGGGLQELGLHSEAIASFKTALSIAPKFAEAHSNLGISLKGTNRFDEALKSYEYALSIRPDFTEAHGNKGNVLKDLGRLDEAVTCYKQALAIRQTYSEAQCNLGSVMMSMGQLDEALICFERTLANKPNHRLAANNYLHTLLYQPSISNDDLFKECRKIADERKSTNTPMPFPMLNLENNNRIRIGYISSDFRDHPVGHNIMPIFANHDYQKYEIFCYAELTSPDSMTNEFQEYADHWRMIKGLTDYEVAEHIRGDNIHIAVFLGGHFDENRPDIASYRAASIQVALYGGTTTALDTMDYWLTDKILHPKNTTEQFTEKLWHLPSLFTYPVPKDTPHENDLPAIKNGYVTFVSFNKPCKINDDVIDLWAEILDAIPESRLHLKFINILSNKSIAKRILARFEFKGIPSKRIYLISKKENAYDHLLRYNQADIALDTFPFSGATTTFQAMWMGVPVVTLLGDRFIARMGGTLMSQVGLGSITANTKDEYLSLAISMAKDINRLQETRKTLRKKISDSSLCNGLLYTQNLEKAYHDMFTV